MGWPKGGGGGGGVGVLQMNFFSDEFYGFIKFLCLIPI